MINAIKRFFEQNFAAPVSEDEIAHQLRLATAALFIEMMQQDHDVDATERQAVKRVLKQKFAIDDDETDELYALAKQEARLATDYHQFTSLIASHFSQPQKIKVIEYLWEIAWSDGVLHKYEEHMVRRIADLIHVSHKDFMQARHRVEQSRKAE
ncbi:MAG: TerB family tellurite resistance protein [Gammaproteobacteria bacterium]|nr:MAG: TerB family tellurite resistance protein [Gammaproteobacteria bacterium]